MPHITHVQLLIHAARLDLFTHTPCTGITSPSTVTPFYTVQTPRGTLTAHHIVHATNGWSSHLLSGLRGTIIPLRGTMTAQRPGSGLPPAAIGSRRAHVFYHTPPGFDYLTQLLKNDEADSDGELLFGGGAMQGGRPVLALPTTVGTV
jgi:glycine/D-amino acid oxidase-like deaminating enzyme